MMFKVQIVVTLCILSLSTSADRDVDCETLYPECGEACGSDLGKIHENYQDWNRCWLHLNCTQYRSCLSQMRSTSPTPPPKAISVTVPNAMISLDASTSSKEPGRTAPSSGSSSNKTTAQPETAIVTEQEPITINVLPSVAFTMAVLVFTGLTVVAVLAILGFHRWRNGKRTSHKKMSRTGGYSGADADGSSADGSFTNGAQGGIELQEIIVTETSDSDIRDKQMIRENDNRVMNRRPGVEEPIRNMAAGNDSEDVEAGLLNDGAAGDGGTTRGGNGLTSPST